MKIKYLILIVILIFTVSCGNKTTEIKFYYPTEEYEFDENSYIVKNIPSENLFEDSIKYVYEYANITIDKIWYENQRICVDLNIVERLRLDGGSAIGGISTNILVMTFASFPNVKEIEILINGERCIMDHYNFSEIFKVN